MEKSLYIDLIANFGSTVPLAALDSLLTQTHIPMTDSYAFRDTADNQALLQEIDSFFSYISILDTIFQSDGIRLPVRILRRDIHIFFLLSANKHITLIHSGTGACFSITVGYGCYFYLPPGDYKLELPCSYLKLFSLCFRGKIFRRGNERQYEFLHTLIGAYRQQKDEVVQSLDLPLSRSIEVLLRRLLAGFKPGNLESEFLIQDQTFELLRLSKEAIFEAHEKIDSVQFLAQRIQEEIRRGIRREGQGFRLEILPHLYQKSMQYLGRIHKDSFGYSLSQARTQALLDLAEEQLLVNPTITSAAYSCGFNDLHQFRRFFKKVSGITPTEYLRQRRQE